MSDGINIEFATCITEKCAEIRDLYEIEEYVRQPNEQNLIEFLYDLSAFLLELECPHKELTCGEITSRFQSPNSRDLLSRFLDSEVKTARLTDSRTTQSQRSPLFKATLDEKAFPEIEKQCESFSRDFYNRLLLLNSRLKVTVESFLWNDRLKAQRENIQSILATRVEEIGKIRTNCDIAHLLSASSSLLYIQKASAMEKRNLTKSKQHPLSVGDAPKDRGGRTEEMVGVKQESCRQ